MLKKNAFLFLGLLVFGGLFLINIPGDEAKGKEVLGFSRVDYGDLPDELKSWVDNSQRQQIAQTKNHEGYTYILVTYGEKPTGGYTVDIKELRLEDNRIEVIVEFQAPSPDQMVTQAFTYPYDLIRIEATQLPFSFTATGERSYIMQLRGIDRLLPIVASSNWIKIFNPAPEKEVDKTFEVEGVASTFEGNILYRLVDNRGDIIKEGFTTAGMGDWYYFSLEMDVEDKIESGRDFILELFTRSPKDGAEENLVTIPLKLK